MNKNSKIYENENFEVYGNEDTIFIIPINKDKPIKVVYED